MGKNGNIVVERLLSISGEDTLTVNRKYRDQWSGKLPCRLHVISNELPRLGDASTAIVGRVVLCRAALKAAPALVEVLAAASLATGAASLGMPTL